MVSAVDGQVRTHDGPAPGAPVSRGPGVPLLEMLSMRDTGEPIPEVVGWLTAGLATVFDQTQAAEPR